MKPSHVNTIDDATVAQLIEAASRAPSVHNTQPWWFGVHGSRLSVHADPDRRLDVADPDGREMLISCGAALFTLRLAARHLGRSAEVRLLPAPDRPLLLAEVDISGRGTGTDDDRRMFEQIGRRRTHRGGFAPSRPSVNLFAKLSLEAEREGAALRIVADPRARSAMAALSEAAEQAQRLDIDHAAELARWSRSPDAHRRDGVHPAAYPREPGRETSHFAQRDFAHGQGWGRHLGEEHHDAPGTVALLMTAGDAPADWLTAGMGLQRVLLRATEADVSAAFHTQALEIPELRAFLRARFCGGAHPQMVMRLGHAGEQGGGSARRRESDITRTGA